jgi:DNA-binding transcriptional ArsR family regulator
MKMIHLGGSEVRLSVSVDVRPSFEFLVSLAALGSPEEWETFDAGSAWFQQAEAAMSSEFADAWGQLGKRAGHVWLNLLPVAHEVAAAHSAAGIVSHLRGLSPVELRRHMLGYYLPPEAIGVDLQQIDQAATGDAAAVAALLRNRKYFGGDADRLSSLLALDPRTTKALAMRVMNTWLGTFFKEHERTVLPALQRDGAAKERLLETTSPERAIELATGIVSSPMPGIHHITLAPQFAYRPWNLFVQRGDHAIWCYPLSDESLEQEGDAPPRQLVRLVKALADEKRLRILRELSSKDATLQDLTEALGMPKSTVHHHLLALRAAGLVKMVTDGEVHYILRREALSEPSGLLKAYLHDQG